MASPRRATAEDGKSVATLARLQDISATLQKKADVNSVASLKDLRKLDQSVAALEQRLDKLPQMLAAQPAPGLDKEVAESVRLALAKVEEISAALEKKADAKDVATAKQLSSLDEKATTNAALIAALEMRLDAAPARAEQEQASQDALNSAMNRVEELAARMEKKADVGKVVTVKQLEFLREEMMARQRANPQSPSKFDSVADKGADMKKLQVVVAAAAARFEKQLKEVRGQVRDLKEKQLGGTLREGALGDNNERWPGRKIDGVKAADAVSDTGSEMYSYSEVGSHAGSLAGSTYGGLAPEEKAELKKIQAIVGAAGTAFSKELREVKGHIGELRGELRQVKDRLPGA